MNPLSLLFRRIIATVFFILFALILVVVSVYASGYRLGEEFTLERTGGVHVAVPFNGAVVYLDGEEVGVSSFLDKSFFIDNLVFGTYSVSVEKEGYRTWEKRLIVERSLVTGAVAFLVPEKIIPLAVVTEGDTSATSTRNVSESEYEALVALFDDATGVATTTEVHENPGSIELALREGNVYVRWKRGLEKAPSAFCIAPQACVVEISAVLSEDEVTHAEFFAGGVVYETSKGIFLSEIDVKQPQMVVSLYEKPGATFRLYKGEVIILDNEELFVVSGF